MIADCPLPYRRNRQKREVEMSALNQRINRREFLKQSARGTGCFAVGAAIVAGSEGFGRAVERDKSVNPFAYDVSDWEKTDPALVRYQEVRRFNLADPEPRRIAVGLGEHLYVASRRGVSIVDRDGGSVGDIPLSSPARCVAVAADGAVYIGLRDHVEVFNVKGERIASWDPASKKAWLTGLAVAEKDVFVADSANRCVLRYDRSGKLLNRIGEKNKERNIPGLIVPSPYLDVDLGRDGLLRVNNPGRHCVELYTPNGDLEGSWGKPSAAIQGFCGCCNPVGLALLPDGECLTCEKGLPRVKVYSANGTFDCVVAGPESFSENGKPGSTRDLSDGTMGGLDAAADSSGRIYILDLVSRDVRVMLKKT
jgi:hypothetical protein